MRRITHIPFRTLFDGSAKTSRGFNCRIVFGNVNLNTRNENPDNEIRFIVFTTNRLYEKNLKEIMNILDDFAVNHFPLTFNRHGNVTDLLTSYRLAHKYQQNQLQIICGMYSDGYLPKSFTPFTKKIEPLPDRIYANAVYIQRDTGNHIVDIFKPDANIYSNVSNLSVNIRHPIINC
jgi:hypothetical protein